MAAKRNRSARLAVVAVVIAAVGCVASGLLALVRASMALGLYMPARPESLTQWIAASVGVLIVGLALYAVLNPAGVRRFFTGRQARYGSNALIMSLAFLGIVIIVNWLAFQNPQKLDVTEDKQHTLAPETIQALDTLPQPVTALGFFSTQYPRTTAETLFNDLKSSSRGKFDYQFVDPNADPVLARQYGITGDGKIVLVMGTAKETVSYADENLMTQAMIRLISPEARVVYFLTGHGEPDLNASDTRSLLRAKESLEGKNYSVEPLNLAAENSVPTNAKAIIIAGAVEPLLDQEVSLLGNYLDGGGSLILLADPSLFSTQDQPAAEDPLATYLQAAWGITLEDTVVIDLSSNQPLSAVSASYSASSPITSRTTSVTIMPQARSLRVSAQAPSDVTLTELILTSNQSWGETNLGQLQSSKEIAFDEATDIAGPLTIAASAENTATKGRVVVFGNSVFARNEGFDAYANGDVFINSVDWAAQETDLINITPKTPVERTFNPPGQLPFMLILLGSVILIPGLVLLAGISSWLARRRQG